MLELLLPEYTKQILENYQNIFSQFVSQLRWLHFDDAFRLVTRVGYLDDGYIRLRLDGHWEFTGELLRELSWTFYSIAEIGKNVDVLYSLVRFGRAVSPFWVVGSEVTAPSAGTALASRTVGAGRRGYVYGVFITAGEANDFRLEWTSGGVSYSLRIPLCGRGAIMLTSLIPLNEGLPADGGTSVAVTNINAGSPGVVYQAAVLYAEV